MPQEDGAPAVAPQADPKVQTATTPVGQTPQTAKDSDSPKPTPKLEDLPPEWQEYFTELRAENKERRLAESKAKEEAANREQKEMEERQEWEKLARQRESEISLLKPVAEENAQLNELIKNQINTNIKDWPKEIVDTAPEGEVSALTMMTWFDKMKPLADKLLSVNSEQSRQTTSGNRPGPTPTSNGSQQQPTGRAVNEPLGGIDIGRRF